MDITCILHYEVCYNELFDVINGFRSAPLGFLFLHINWKELQCQKKSQSRVMALEQKFS